MASRSFRRILRGKDGQTAVEYLLTTIVLIAALMGMFAFLQNQLTRLFRMAGVKILTTYPVR